MVMKHSRDNSQWLTVVVKAKNGPCKTIKPPDKAPPRKDKPKSPFNHFV